jgi:hypothetical protein
MISVEIAPPGPDAKPRARAAARVLTHRTACVHSYRRHGPRCYSELRSVVKRP